MLIRTQDNILINMDAVREIYISNPVRETYAVKATLGMSSERIIASKLTYKEAEKIISKIEEAAAQEGISVVEFKANGK